MPANIVAASGYFKVIVLRELGNEVQTQFKNISTEEWSKQMFIWLPSAPMVSPPCLLYSILNTIQRVAKSTRLMATD